MQLPDERRAFEEATKDGLFFGQGIMKGGEHVALEKFYRSEEEQKAYSQGYKAGRDSRDGLREELKRLQSVVGQVDYDLIEEALAADGAGK